LEQLIQATCKINDEKDARIAVEQVEIMWPDTSVVYFEHAKQNVELKSKLA
jgi:hypothetical protein